MRDAKIVDYFSGAKLYGDDFSERQIVEWFKDEEEAYANLGSRDRSSYSYGYHALNYVHGYRYLPAGRFKHVLSLGGAYGEELEPIAPRADSITIVDPSQAFTVNKVNGTPVNFVNPSPKGTLPLDDSSCDLITCFGTLHHIPNVSYVFAELARCLRAGGYMLVREPIISMGDWRFPRKGLTSRERGIPPALFEQIISTTRLQIVRQARCVFPLTRRLTHFTKYSAFNSTLLVKLDAFLSRAFSFNERYHAESRWQKVRPNSVFLVLRKPVNTPET